MVVSLWRRTLSAFYSVNSRADSSEVQNARCLESYKAGNGKASEYLLIPHGAEKYSLVLIKQFGMHLNTYKQCIYSNPWSYVHRHIMIQQTHIQS